MKLIIHDLEEEQLENFYLAEHDDKIISKDNKIHKCMGCFGCWVRTPGQCVIKDEFQKMGEWIASADKVVIISRCVYGSYSPFVKNVLDRSISYIHPYFTKRNGEVHHRSRYHRQQKFEIIFYGEQILSEEKETAMALTKANAVNFNTTEMMVKFCDMEGVLV